MRKNQRVRPSAAGIAANIFPKTRRGQSGIIVDIKFGYYPLVLWDGRKMPQEYHYSFIDPDRRRRASNPQHKDDAE